jgi:hypothetical protein
LFLSRNATPISHRRRDDEARKVFASQWVV